VSSKDRRDERRGAAHSDARGTDRSDPRSAAVTFVTTEHFVLQGARAATISESTGRATCFSRPFPAAWSPWAS